MDPSHQCLIDEIKRQIRILESDAGENRRVEQKKEYMKYMNTGITNARQQNTDQRYRNALLDLLSNLTSGMHIRIPIVTNLQVEIDW